jgi:hypothetical protein
LIFELSLIYLSLIFASYSSLSCLDAVALAAVAKYAGNGKSRYVTMFLEDSFGF